MDHRHPKKENLQYQNQIHRVYHKFGRKPNHFEMDRCKSKNGASVFEVLALFNFSLDGSPQQNPSVQLPDHLSVYLSVISSDFSARLL